MTEPAQEPPPDWVALAGAAATAALNFALMAAGPSLSFIAGACLFWSIFIVVRVRRSSSSWVPPSSA
jgi:hypothetical protein